MTKILELLSNRRIWAGIFGMILIFLPIFGVNLKIDANTLTESFTNFFIAFSMVVTAVMPIWSYFMPKK